jgi:MFS family permease
MISSAPLPPRAWLAVGLLWFVACLNYLDRLILITMRTSVKGEIAMTDAQFGLLTSVFLVSYGILGPVGGYLADRFNRSQIIVVSLFAWSAFTWLTGHAHSFEELLIYRALMGISEACYFPAAGKLLMDYHRDRTRSLANGIHLSGVMVGSGLGGLGGWIADQHDWRFVFELFGAIGVVYAVVVWIFLRDRPPTDSVRTPGAAAAEPAEAPLGLATSLRALFTSPAYLLALCFWGLLGVGSWTVIGWLPTYLTERFGLSQGAAGLSAMGYIYSASMVGMLVAGYWADRWSARHPRARVWVGIIGTSLTVPAILVIAYSPSLPLLFAGLVLYGLARTFPDANMLPILCQIVDRRVLALGFGILNMLAVFVGGASIYAGGAFRDAQVPITAVFTGGAVTMAICVVLLWKVRAPAAPASSPSPSSS